LKEGVQLGGRDTEFDLYNNAGGYKVMLDKRMKGKPCPACGTVREGIPGVLD